MPIYLRASRLLREEQDLDHLLTGNEAIPLARIVIEPLFWAVWLAIDPRALGAWKDGLHQIGTGAEGHLGSAITKLWSAITRCLAVVAAHDFLGLVPVLHFNEDIVRLSRHAVLYNMNGSDTRGLWVVLDHTILSKCNKNLVDLDIEGVL